MSGRYSGSGQMVTSYPRITNGQLKRPYAVKVVPTCLYLRIDTFESDSLNEGGRGVALANPIRPATAKRAREALRRRCDRW